MKTDYTHYVQNQSSREGGRPKIIVTHTTEGFVRKEGRNQLGDLIDLGGFFDQASVGASAHLGIDMDGNDARYVPDSMKAWTQCNLNPMALGVELLAYARYTEKEWMVNNKRMLSTYAKWIAFWSKKYDIPIRMAWTSGVNVIRSGVTTHKRLGASGCGHVDPGPGFPMQYVLLLARLIYEEHFNKKPDSRKAKRIRRKVNRRRRKFDLPAIRPALNK